MIKLFLIGLAVIVPGVQSALAKDGGKIVLVKGKVSVKNRAGAVRSAAEGQAVEVGDVISTEANSVAKVFLIDGTELSVGPASKVSVDDVSEDRPSFFSLAVGTLRAKVKKSVSGETKAVVRSPGSVMGVRGTDFQAIYNNASRMTSLVTYEGQVAMVKSEGSTLSIQGVLENYNKSATDPNKVAVVNPGQFSGVLPTQDAPLLPVKISPSQLESLKNSELGAGVSPTQNTNTQGNNAISPVPPGIDARLMAPESAAELELAAKRTGTRPEGGVDSGRVAPPAGGFVDVTTGVYIPPPPGSSFDAVNGVYVPPPSVGAFDPNTGAYVPPPGVTVDPVQGLVRTVVDPNTGTTTTQSTGLGGVNIAEPPPPMMLPPASPGFDGAAPKLAGTTDTGDQAGGFYQIAPPEGGEGDSYPGYVDGRPLFPVYNPFLCPPYCDPAFQPGFYEGMPVPMGSTTVRFNIQ